MNAFTLILLLVKDFFPLSITQLYPYTKFFLAHVHRKQKKCEPATSISNIITRLRNRQQNKIIRFNLKPLE